MRSPKERMPRAGQTMGQEPTLREGIPGEKAEGKRVLADRMMELKKPVLREQRAARKKENQEVQKTQVLLER